MEKNLRYLIKNCSIFNDDRLEELMQGWMINNKFDTDVFAFGDNEEMILTIDYINDSDKKEEIYKESKRLLDSLRLNYSYVN